MSSYNTTPPGKDPEIWEIAQRRASFKSHLGVYIVINIFLWAIWYFTDGKGYGPGHWPWPVWTTLGWGIGLLFHFMGAYVFPKSNSVEKEYEKLTRERK